MKILRAASWTLTLACALSGAAPTPSKTPSEAYLAYVAAAQKAGSLEEVFPHLSKEYRAMLASRPKDEKSVWLQRLKESVEMTELRINKETISGLKCTLEGSAKSSRGLPLKGKVFLVKEDGGWKLDEQFWST